MIEYSRSVIRAARQLLADTAHLVPRDPEPNQLESELLDEPRNQSARDDSH